MLNMDSVNDILSEEILIADEVIRGRRKVYHGVKRLIFTPLTGNFTVFTRDTHDEREVRYSGPDKELAVQIFNDLCITDL